jgi:NADH-quinone oxidoreductase subunit N
MTLPGAAPLIILIAATGIALAVIAIRRAHLLAAAAAAFGLCAALISVPFAMRAAVTPGLFTFNTASLGFIALILLSALLILFIATAYWTPQTPLPREEFSLILLIGTSGAVALAAAANFIALFLGLETMTLAMIGMIAYPRFRPAAEEAGLKYLILSGMSSAFLLFGIGLIELGTGSLGFAQIIAQTAPDPASQTMLIAGLAMIGIAAGFKLSVVPFHIWVPDIYAGAPAPSGAYVAVIAKIAVLAVIIRVIALPGAVLPTGLVTAITWIAISSMLAGNLLALLQNNLKRILGYSSIAHLGYLLVAILAAGSIGHIAVLFYLVTYAITMIGAFGVIAALSGADAAQDADKLADLRGLFWTRPALAAVLTLVVLSLAGIPPAIGFIAKMYIMAAGIHTQLWSLTAVMVVSSVIGLFYYLNIILVMSAKTPADPAQANALTMPLFSRFAIAVISAPVIAFGIAPGPLIALLKSVFA